VAWLDAERPALTAAVALAAAIGRDQVAMRLQFSLGRYLEWQRRFDDWAAALYTSLAAARRLGDIFQCSSLWPVRTKRQVAEQSRTGVTDRAPSCWKQVIIGDFWPLSAGG
jgi:hypothetical protein